MGKDKRNLKSPKANTGKNIQAPNTEDTITITHHKHPIFCLKYLHKDYGLSQCTPDEKVALIDQFAILSQLSWVQLGLANRHGVGSEKISLHSIKKGISMPLTEDVTDLFAFRFNGKMPMIGHRDRFLFHVLFIDRNHEIYS